MGHQSEIYQDTGCVFYPRCLDCPFPLIGGNCLFDAQDTVQADLRQAEARELARQGKSAREIARILGVSEKQVKRYLDIALLTKP
jgi:DNA invertase Pin-like site-specific DNA recombinase